MIINCKVCKKEFKVEPWRIKRSKVICCSRDCQFKAQRIMEVGQKCSFCDRLATHITPEFSCKMHYDRWWRTGSFTGRTYTPRITNTGYLRVNLRGGKNIRVLQHRYIMEQHIGRPLKRTESVHHIDGDKTNNNINNLMLFPSEAAHQKFHNLNK